MIRKAKETIGRVEPIELPEYGLAEVPARIDTGAKTSAIWASDIAIDENRHLSFYLFGPSSPYFNNQRVTTKKYAETVVSSSMGASEKRYKVKMLIKLRGRKIRASFTLADRSKQVYPIILGRSILRGKFVVDVAEGKPLHDAEEQRTAQLRAQYQLDDRQEP